MNPRRADQLTRAAKLRANVSVLLGVGNEAPTVVDLAAVNRRQLERSTRVVVQVLSWIDDRAPVEYMARAFDGSAAYEKDESLPVTEELLAKTVDLALEQFEKRGKSQAGSTAP